LFGLTFLGVTAMFAIIIFAVVRSGRKRGAGTSRTD